MKNPLQYRKLLRKIFLKLDINLIYCVILVRQCFGPLSTSVYCKTPLLTIAFLVLCFIPIIICIYGYFNWAFNVCSNLGLQKEIEVHF